MSSHFIFCYEHNVLPVVLPPFYLKANTKAHSQTTNHPAFVIVLACIVCFYKIIIIQYRSNDSDVVGKVELNTYAWRNKEAESLLFL
jgi:hypothetical protein